MRRQYRNPSNVQSQLGLTHLLLHMRHHEATDPKDRIFALLGLADEDLDQHALRVDYNRTVEEVSISVTRYLIETHHDLQILGMAGHVSTEAKLPSWVPDWSRPLKTRLLDAAGPYLQFRVCGENFVKPSIFDTSDPKKLGLRGVCVGTVERVYHGSFEVGGYHSRNRRGFHTRRQRQRIAAFIGSPDSCSPTHEDVEIAWLRTISGGLFPDKTRLHTSFAQVRYPRYTQWCVANEILEAPPEDVVAEVAAFPRFWTVGRAVFMTEGYIGLGPAKVQPGDRICLLFGGTLPYVLRPLGGDEFILLGSSYVHRMMNGEVYHKSNVEAHEQFILI